jgi:tetratricopeptide (TPR) repeat protein
MSILIFIDDDCRLLILVCNMIVASFYWTSNASLMLSRSLTVLSNWRSKSTLFEFLPIPFQSKGLMLSRASQSRNPPNVLPLVNKGLALYQWEQNIGAAERCCNEALRIDPECDAAVATLAQLSLQQGKIDQAVEYFNKQTELARTEPELVSALTYKHVSMLCVPLIITKLTMDLSQASLAQLEFAKNYPAMAAQLSSMAQGMM